MANTTADQFDKNWKQYADQAEPINIVKYFSMLTLQNLMNTLFPGNYLDTHAFSPMTRELLYLIFPHIYYTRVKFLNLIPMPSYFRFKKLNKSLKDLVNDAIKVALKDDKIEGNIIKHLANAYGYFHYEKLTEEMKEHLSSEAIMFLIAGHETTASTMSYISVHLSQFPLIADKLYEEVQTILENRLLNYEDIEKLNFTNAVIKETLRLNPPARFIVRECLEDDVIAGYPVKKGEFIFIPVSTTQRLNQYWINPEGFDPTRFLYPLTNEQNLLYMPFGHGERSCIGSQFAMFEEIIILASLAQRYRLALTPGCSLHREKEMIDWLNKDITMNVISNKLFTYR